VTRLVIYPDRTRAFADLGLVSDDSPPRNRFRVSGQSRRADGIDRR
jgi:hypothetical protein